MLLDEDGEAEQTDKHPYEGPSAQTYEAVKLRLRSLSAIMRYGSTGRGWINMTFPIPANVAGPWLLCTCPGGCDLKGPAVKQLLWFLLQDMHYLLGCWRIYSVFAAFPKRIDAVHGKLQTIRKGRDRSEAMFRSFRQCFEQHAIYLAGKMSNDATRWRWNRVQMLVHDFRRRVAAKGKLPCQELVRHHCQCILIRGRHRLVVPLLRSHIVLGPADGLPRTRHCRHELGKTEISKQDIGTTWIRSVAPDEHIAGFDILVNDPTIMSMLEGICELA